MNAGFNLVSRAFLLIAIATCARTAAADDSGWYIGAGLGDADYGKRGILHYDSETLDATAIDDSDDPLSSSISLAFGYRFNRYLSLEAGYAWNDSTEYALTDAAGARFGTYEFRTQGASLAVVGILPLGNWELLARAGVMYADTEGSLFTDAGTLEDERVHTAEALIAIGGAYNFTEHWQAKLDYAFVNDAGEPHETGHADTKLLTLGFTYRF